MKTAVTTGQVRHCWPDFVSISSQLPSLSASQVYSSRASFTECQGCIWKGNKRGITLRSAPWRKAIWCGEIESRQFRSFWLSWMAADVLTRAAHRANRLQSMQTSPKLHVSRFFPRTLFKTCFTWNFSSQQSAACQEPQAPAVKKKQTAKSCVVQEGQTAGTDRDALASLLTATACLLPITIILCPAFCPTIWTVNQRELFLCAPFCCRAPALTGRSPASEGRASEPLTAPQAGPPRPPWASRRQSEPLRVLKASFDYEREAQHAGGAADGSAEPCSGPGLAGPGGRRRPPGGSSRPGTGSGGRRPGRPRAPLRRRSRSREGGASSRWSAPTLKFLFAWFSVTNAYLPPSRSWVKMPGNEDSHLRRCQVPGQVLTLSVTTTEGYEERKKQNTKEEWKRRTVCSWLLQWCIL